ncbi:Dam family site-specific DNA-(adenine-N6)-methyltransferase [Niallia sp. FSL W8-0951]|uniref:Dam family site-specific DNA-(adenine-N6)-methyltransferase n=1 Tax=Niallia sp. FSL W8-0951 TaxID=2954639 RepID=UPI0030F81AEA
MDYNKKNLVKSPLNYAGGKYKLLDKILPHFPNEIETFIDLFTGGANVGVNINADKINCLDVNPHVIKVLNWFKATNPEKVLSEVESVIEEYNLTNTFRNGYEYYGTNSNKGVAKVNKENYYNLKADFNMGRKDSATLYTVILYAFNNMIKFNKQGDFNTAVNKRDLNGNVVKNILRFVETIHNKNIRFTADDFRNLNVNKLNDKSLVFCDPPYLVTETSYNNIWTEKEEQDLLKFLDDLNQRGIKFVLTNVLNKGEKRNELLINWSEKYNTYDLHNNYNNCVYNKSDKDVEYTEVLIKNF